jgi:hypothetical protein
MTQVIFQTIVYRQIISLRIHYIPTPVGKKFTYTKLTAFKTAWKISENVMALEASDRLIDKMSQLEVYMWMYFKADLQTQCLFT